MFDNIVLPVWRGRIIHDIKRRDIIELVEGVADDRPIMANRTHAHLSKFFNWLCERDAIAASPCAGREASQRRACARAQPIGRRDQVSVVGVRRNRRPSRTVHKAHAPDWPAPWRGRRHAPLRDQRRCLGAAAERTKNNASWFCRAHRGGTMTTLRG